MFRETFVLPCFSVRKQFQNSRSPRGGQI